MRALLQNPVVITSAIVFVATMAIVLIGVFMMRTARREFVPRPEENQTRVSAENLGFSLAAYEGVIRRLKDQEKELDRLRRLERERATESESLSEAVLSNLISGVVIFNTSTMVRQANPAARKLFGYASPFGLHARDLFRGVTAVRTSEGTSFADAEAAATLVRAVEGSIREGAQVRRMEVDYRTPSGEARVLGVTLSPVRGLGGEGMGAAALISDLTEITRLSQQMRLRESMAALGEMSAGIAHEFKNSLATISGYSQMLERDLQEDASRQFAGKITTETTALARIVGDFLNFARPQGIAREPVPLRAVLEDCATEARVKLDASGLPPEMQLPGDPVALRQAFSNLLRNSAEAGGEGRTIAVKATAQTKPGSISLTLADDGPGIPEENLSRIFIPFFTTKSEGTGLGLALVHRIVAEHGGSISVMNTHPGTAFTLTFPLLDNPRAPIQTGVK